VHVQFNDIDGPNNEEVFVPICAGDVQWIRIDSNATTGRNFGTVGPYAETFSLMARILVKDAESNRGKSNKSSYFFSAENSLRCHKLLNQGCCHPR
jgi:hypothetical protein